MTQDGLLGRDKPWSDAEMDKLLSEKRLAEPMNLSQTEGLTPSQLQEREKELERLRQAIAEGRMILCGRNRRRR